MIAAAVTGHRVEDPILGEIYFRYIDGDVFVSISSILSNMGEWAVPYIRGCKNETITGFEGKGILYFPSKVVFDALEDFEAELKKGKGTFDLTKFYVATIFADWVRLQKTTAQFLHLQKKYVGEDIEMDHKSYSANDVIDILNSFHVSIKKPTSFW